MLPNTILSSYVKRYKISGWVFLLFLFCNLLLLISFPGSPVWSLSMSCLNIKRLGIPANTSKPQSPLPVSKRPVEVKASKEVTSSTPYLHTVTVSPHHLMLAWGHHWGKRKCGLLGKANSALTTLPWPFDSVPSLWMADRLPTGRVSIWEGGIGSRTSEPLSQLMGLGTKSNWGSHGPEYIAGFFKWWFRWQTLGWLL